MQRGTIFGAGAALALLVMAAPVFGQAIFKSSTVGTPKVQSIDALAFGPKGLLLIADGRGNQVIAVDTKDTTPTAWSNMKIADIRKELAGRLGTTAKGIEILRLAVNPASQRVYVAVRKLGADKQDLLLTVDGKGKIRPFDLEKVTYARVQLAAPKQVQSVTDIVFAEDRILVSAQANERFRSKMFSIDVPIAHDSKTASNAIETYHVAHRNWETRSPIYTMIPYQEKGKNYVVGALTCTPVVKYSIDDFLPNAKVKGQSIIEVGSGNRPRDMFVYSKGKKKFILMSTFRFHHSRRPVGPSPYWVVKIDYDLLAEAQNINQKALKRVNRQYENVTDRANVVKTYHGVMYMDQLDARRAVVVRAGDAKQQSLEVIALP